MAVPSPSPSGKSRLRADALAARRAYAQSLDPGTRERLEAALAERVLPRLVTARVIAFYHPMKDEISPYPLLARLSREQQAALPWFADRDSKMIWREAPAVETGPWGVLQPSPDSASVRPDLVIVPLVLADRRGTRIGHGKGHYDRALAHLREAGDIKTIGIGWDHQLSQNVLPPDPWDVPLDAVATPGVWADCR